MIGWHDANERGSGGFECQERNYMALRNFFGDENVEFFYLYKYYLGYSIKHKYIRKINLIVEKPCGLCTRNEKFILGKIHDKDIVYIDRSLYGRWAKLVKKKFPQKKVIVFFHGAEFFYQRQERKNFLIRFVMEKLAFKGETIACKYSDSIICLNFRDARQIEQLYHRKADAVIPVSFPNREIKIKKKKVKAVPTGLFLGNNFFPNIHGIKWFIERVLPYVDINLTVAGNNMDKADLPKNEKLLVIGYVEDMDECMQDADFMVFPVFQGSGMKVKTCNALMHGKNIIGTREAFEGYDVDFEKVGSCCETADEFIRAINEFPKRFTRKFNEYSRNLFLEKYCNDVTFGQFAEVFEKVEEK
jgi:glycosyltransferase involved in cell wall biosynthesis